MGPWCPQVCTHWWGRCPFSLLPCGARAATRQVPRNTTLVEAMTVMGTCTVPSDTGDIAAHTSALRSAVGEAWLGVGGGWPPDSHFSIGVVGAGGGNTTLSGNTIQSKARTQFSSAHHMLAGGCLRQRLRRRGCGAAGPSPNNTPTGAHTMMCSGRLPRSHGGSRWPGPARAARRLRPRGHGCTLRAPCVRRCGANSWASAPQLSWPDRSQLPGRTIGRRAWYNAHNWQTS